jgi:hypothetical protein
MCLGVWQMCAEALRLLRPFVEHGLHLPMHHDGPDLLCTLSGMHQELQDDSDADLWWPPDWGPSPFE